MERFFNTAGPNIAADHYTIAPLTRVDWVEIQWLIAQKRYFLLHAPRQTGKTSVLLDMMATLNEAEHYAALYVNVEIAQTARNHVEVGIRLICEAIATSARVYKIEPRLEALVKTIVAEKQGQGALLALLTQWAEMSHKPVVLFIDEADALMGDTLVSLLRQIRSGYHQRPAAFPHSIVLCGLRDIKDYRIHVSNGDIITGGSAFNIKAESLRLDDFSKTQVAALYQQHSEETGQHFADGILDEVWADTNGQPWLVNALAHEMTHKDKSARNRHTTIELEAYRAARERLITVRATHLDQLADKLKETRIHRVIAPLLSGEQTELTMDHDDLQYAADLGLIKRKPFLSISNRLYREVIPRELTAVTQDTMVQKQAWYLDANHHLNMPKLLTAFQQFFRENADSWIERFDYKEAGPQLLMQAFLQRIVNGGGRINREYGLGRKRTDLMLEWPIDESLGFYGTVQRIVIELKIQRGDLARIIEQGVSQTLAYADTLNADETHLVIFNRNQDIPWDKKIWHLKQHHQGRDIRIWGA